MDFSVYPTPDLKNFREHLSGDNQAHVLVGFLNEQQASLVDFLEKIIGATQLNLQKDCLILRGRLEGDKMALPNFSDLKNERGIQKAVLFGIRPQDLGLNIAAPLYYPFVFNGCVFLFAEKLSAIETSKDKKGALWTCLQQIFLRK